MSIITYKLTNLLITSLNIEDLGIILQARGGEDSIRTITSDSYERSSKLKEFIRNKWVSAHEVAVSTPRTRHKIQAPIKAPDLSPQLQSSDVVALQDELRAMNSRFDEILTALKSIPSAPPPVIVHVPVHTASSNNEYVNSKNSDIPSLSDPIFIPSSIVPKDANVQINTNSESSSGHGFDDSLAALKAARKKKPIETV